MLKYPANHMITIGTLKLDLVADREPFVHDLYGRWDTFNRTSLEGIVDEILSRYDTEDELIRIESLDLDLGELEEDEFYEQFPRRLAERLDELLADDAKRSAFGAQAKRDAEATFLAEQMTRKIEKLYLEAGK